MSSYISGNGVYHNGRYVGYVSDGTLYSTRNGYRGYYTDDSGAIYGPHGYTGVYIDWSGTEGWFYGNNIDFVLGAIFG